MQALPLLWGSGVADKATFDHLCMNPAVSCFENCDLCARFTLSHIPIDDSNQAVGHPLCDFPSLQPDDLLGGYIFGQPCRHHHIKHTVIKDQSIIQALHSWKRQSSVVHLYVYILIRTAERVMLLECREKIFDQHVRDLGCQMLLYRCNCITFAPGIFAPHPHL